MQPVSRLPGVGQSVCGVYVVDTGFEGVAWHQRWQYNYGSQVIGRPQRTSRHSWPKPLRRWLAGLRQIVETVFDKLDTIFRLEWERPHALDGFQARLAAKVALHHIVAMENTRRPQNDVSF